MAAIEYLDKMPKLSEIQTIRKKKKVFRSQSQSLAYQQQQAMQDLRQHLQESIINTMSNSTLKIDQKVMELLRVMDISRLIAYTSLGELKLQLRKGEKEYKLILDAVPLEEELNKELMELLFAKDTVPQVNKVLSKDSFHIEQSKGGTPIPKGKTTIVSIDSVKIKKIPEKGKKKK